MKLQVFPCILILLAIAPSSAMAALEPPVHPLFDGDAVHEINLTFDQIDWWSQLTYNFQHYEDVPYIVAGFDWEDVHFDSIGVRFKGLSSYSYPGYKKSFKLDIDEFVDGQEVYGLDKLNLNNCWMDPSFVREKVGYELCKTIGLPTERTNYAAVYINGEYWGLYILVEQLDQEFIESRFGPAEEGNLWKGDDHGTMEYLGSEQFAYYGEYELKTNEEENDWSTLIEFVDVLNNTSISGIPDAMHNLADINTAIALLAFDNLTVNLDSYVGRCANYYFYHRDLDDRFVFANWDLNMAWGVYNEGMSISEMEQLTPYYVREEMGEERPMAEIFWQVSAYDDLFLGHMKKLMAGPAHPDSILPRMEELRDLVRDYVYDDPNCMFTTSDFEAAMTTDISGGMSSERPPGMTIPGLNNFITNRHTYMSGLIGTWDRIDGLILNEVMASNGSTVPDDNGDYDDWIEIANISGSAIDLNGLILTDHWEGVADFVFPDTTLQSGDYIVVWADEETEQGDLHAPFKLDADGEDVYLVDGTVIMDQVTFPELASDISWGRWENGTGEWQLMSAATPDAENQNPEEPNDIVLYINEFLALNDNVNQDETGAYEDWLEIYNPGPDPIDMGGLFLTDDFTNTTQWMFPDTTLEAGEFLLVWCDNDEEDGPLHTNFKLSGDGEELGLFNTLAAGNSAIDSLTFGTQSDDISYGRYPDGADNWMYFDVPTPGATNISYYICGDVNASEFVDIDDVVYLIQYLFAGGPEPIPLAGGDVDCSGGIDIDDVVYLISYLFQGGPSPCDPDGNGTPDC